jgi:hypothetical protein
MRHALALSLFLVTATPGVAQTATPGGAQTTVPSDNGLQSSGVTAAAALAQTSGQWTGELQYRDYQSNSWQGLPMTVTVVAQPDGVTTVRTAQYDDGPQTGIVTITSMTMVDPAAGTASYALFRKGRAADIGLARIVDFRPGADAQHWTMVTTQSRSDGGSMADVRETTIRSGTSMTTLKDVNPEGDGLDQWLPRNRTVLTLAPADG